MKNIFSDIWRDFRFFNPKWIEDMKNSYHGWTNFDDNLDEFEEISEIILNPHHEEGSCWNHVLLVYQEVIMREENVYTDNEMKELVVSALIHDIGKPYVRYAKIDDNGKKIVRFSGHEYLSSLMAIPFIFKYFQTEEERLRLLNTIALHTMIYREDLHNYITDEKTFQLICRLGKCDHNGRISENKHNNIEQYWSGKRHCKTIEKNDHVLTIMIGIPGCGKTYYAKNYGKVFSTDDVMEEYARKNLFIKGDYTACFKAVSSSNFDWTSETIDRLFRYFDEKKQNVVLDATNMTRKRRLKIAKKAYQRGMKVRMVMVWRDFKSCKNCRTTDKLIYDNVYKRMLSSFSYPHIDEYDELKHIIC